MYPGGKTEFCYYFATAILSFQERGLKSSTGVLSSAEVCVMLHVNKAVISMHQAGSYYWSTLKRCTESWIRYFGFSVECLYEKKKKKSYKKVIVFP